MRWLVFSLLLFALLASGAPARADAQTDVQAREAYDLGAAAYEHKDFPRAASLFAHADELVPNPLVLKLALAAVVQTDDAVLGMTLALRADTRAVDGSLADLSREVRARFEGKVGIVRVVCRARGGCHARLGERSAGDGEAIVALPGDVEIMFDETDHPARVPVRVIARGVVRATEPEATQKQAIATLTPPPKAPAMATSPNAPASADRSGLPRGVFWGGVALTAVLGGLTVASGLDTAHQHTAFLADPTPDGKDRGQSAEARTNIGVVATLVSGALTSVIGLLLTDWKGPPGVVAF